MKNYRENSSIRVLGNIVLLVLIGGSAIAQMIYTIPWATTQPKFVFPLYFENAQGDKDTLYLGYDPAATGYGVLDYDSDGVFGVKKLFVDTNDFYACWATDLRISGSQSRLKDSVYKANVSSLKFGKIPLLTTIYINGGTLPLKVSWDISSLRSDSLPFGHVPPEPNAQGKFAFYYSGDEYMSENGQQILCTNDRVILSDSISLAVCSGRDSITIKNINSLPIPVSWGFLDFYIEDWTGLFLGLNPSDNSDEFVIYPNPFINVLNIKTNLYCNECFIEIYNVFGKLVYNDNTGNKIPSSLDLSSLAPGSYIFRFFNFEYSKSSLIIKL